MSRGVEIIQKWPRARGKKLHPKTKAQMEYFRQAQWAFKLSSAWVQRSYAESVHGTPLMPRDLFLMAASGRMHSVIDENGIRWWSVAAKKNISDSLDVIAQLPGQMLFRRQSGWSPLPAGTAGYVLTYQDDDTPPSWEPPSGSGTAAWGTITGTLADQTDLEAALSARALLVGGNNWTGDQVIDGNLDIEGTLTVDGSPISASAEWGHITGTLADQADLQSALDAKLSVIQDPLTPNAYWVEAAHPFFLGVKATDSDAFCAIEVASGNYARLHMGDASGTEFASVQLDPDTGFVECSGGLPFNFEQAPCVAGVPIGAASTGGRALLATLTLGTAPTFVDFGSISQGYSDLILEYECRNGSGGTANFWMQFNGDTGTNYSSFIENRFGASADGAHNSAAAGLMDSGSFTAGCYGVGAVSIFGYSSSTRFKQVLGRGFYPSIPCDEHHAGQWRSNAAITDIRLVTTAGPTFQAGSKFRLYGLA